MTTTYVMTEGDKLIAQADALFELFDKEEQSVLDLKIELRWKRLIKAARLYEHDYVYDYILREADDSDHRTTFMMPWLEGELLPWLERSLKRCA